MNDDLSDKIAEKIAEKHVEALEKAARQERYAEAQAAEDIAFRNFLSEISTLKASFRDETRTLEDKLKGKAGATSLADAGWEAIRIKYTDRINSIIEQDPGVKYEAAYEEGARNILKMASEITYQQYKSEIKGGSVLVERDFGKWMAKERESLECSKDWHRKSKEYQAHSAVEGFRNYIAEREEYLISSFGSESEKTAMRQKKMERDAKLQNEQEEAARKKLKQDVENKRESLKGTIEKYQKEIEEFGWSPIKLLGSDEKCYWPFLGTVGAVFFFFIGLIVCLWSLTTGVIFFIIGVLIFGLALKSKIKKVNKEKDKFTIPLEKAKKALADLNAKVDQGKIDADSLKVDDEKNDDDE